MTLSERENGYVIPNTLRHKRESPTRSITVLIATWPVFENMVAALQSGNLAVDCSAWFNHLLLAAGTAAAFAIQKYYTAQGESVPPQPARPVPSEVVTLHSASMNTIAAQRATVARMTARQ